MMVTLLRFATASYQFLMERRLTEVAPEDDRYSVGFAGYDFGKRIPPRLAILSGNERSLS